MPRRSRLPSISSLLTLGGALKRKEMISARFGDILSELYLASAALKRWNDEGRHQADDFPLLDYCLELSFATIEARFDELLGNFPVRPVAWLLALLHCSRSAARSRGPSDRVTDTCADLITTPSAARDRLTVDLYHPTEMDGSNGIALVERAFTMIAEVQPIRDRMHAARVRDIDQAVKQGTINADEAAKLKAVADAVAAAIAVDDFAPEELTVRGARDRNRENGSKGRSVIASDITSPAGSGGVAHRPVYIVDGSRTPFIKARGAPGPFTPVDLAVQCGRPLLLRQPFAPDAFDQVILGCVNVIADEMNPARVAALRLGMGEAMTAFTVQINCGSGMQSIDTAYRYIREGVSDLVLAGGAEALSHAPLVFNRSAVKWYAQMFAARGIGAKLSALLGFRPSMLTPVIGLERGLTDPITELNMGQTAELVGHLFHITRRQADEYAAESQQRLGRRAEERLPRQRNRAGLRTRRHLVRP